MALPVEPIGDLLERMASFSLLADRWYEELIGFAGLLGPPVAGCPRRFHLPLGPQVLATLPMIGTGRTEPHPTSFGRFQSRLGPRADPSYRVDRLSSADHR